MALDVKLLRKMLQHDVAQSLTMVIGSVWIVMGLQ
eukprot:CAMPEP_0202817300 /NCGR_PEP_ID=MMETSP1389-20130828/7550_1 /ASSEMBLY_ACC=CAM_ASM_000865 /TAXON_ID=302021 /ORGANISM="Rhodomonas sp., Strain CCMP768" /LENGTH=34 /DNA_ID= /DNA_START= /DNA_END= /DNA_ORIENTATION=